MTAAMTFVLDALQKDLVAEVMAVASGCRHVGLRFALDCRWVEMSCDAEVSRCVAK